MNTPRFALVGMGGFARTHHSYMRKLAAAGLGRQVGQVAIAADRQNFGAEVEALTQQGMPIYASLRQMLAQARDEIDVVCLPLGIALHRPMTIAALEAGCHVVVEKPAAGSVQDIDAMLAARDRSGRLCAVGFQHLYQREIQQLKRRIVAGEFGPIQRIKGYGCWPRPPAYYRRNAWAGCLALEDTWVLDSPHHNALGHAVNLMCYLGSAQPAAAVQPVSIEAELYRANQIESADTAVLRVQTAEDVQLFFAVSHCTDRTIDPVFVIEAEHASIELTYDGQVDVAWADGRREKHGVVEEDAVGVFEDIAAVLCGTRQSLACPLDLTRAQVVCTCGSFEASDIHQLPEHVCVPDSDTGLVVVNGMTETVQEAFERTALFTELGVSWARAGAEVGLTGYDYFPSLRPRVGDER